MKHTGTSSPAYRRDIDGLRAIAVLATIAYHLNPPFLPGGFLGVDVFFTISGYLIIGQLLDQWRSTSRISWSAFYASRVKRLLPANLLVLACSLLIGCLILWPGGDLQSLAKSTIAAALGVANLFFWKVQSTDYFQMGSQPVPLMHTWSLGVEEQFYACMPLLFGLAAYFFKRSSAKPRLRLSIWLGIGVAASLLVALWTSRFHPEAGFYNVPARAYEFFLGALVYVAIRAPSKHSTAEAAAWLGLVCLSASFLSFNDEFTIPGIWALIPVIGCALILWSGRLPGASTQLFLASVPLRWIGLRSYSIYLWHWPLLVFWREYTFYSASIWSEVLICLVAIALSDLSYRFVEIPARQKAWSKSLKPSSAIALGVLASTLAVGAAAGTGLYARMIRQQSPEIIASVEELQGISSCFLGQATPKDCNAGSPQATKSVLVWGDSHAAHLKFALPHVAAQTNSHIVISAIGGCPPVPNYIHPVKGNRDNCTSVSNNSTDIIMRSLDSGPTVVVLAARWEPYLYEEPLSYQDKPAIFKPEGDSDTAESFATKLTTTVASITAQGAAVVLVAPIPEQNLHIPKCQYRSRIFLDGNCNVPKRSVDEYQAESLILLKRIVNITPNVSLLTVNDAFCDELVCYGMHDGHLLYADDDHLGSNGIRLLEDRLAREVNAAFTSLERQNH